MGGRGAFVDINSGDFTFKSGAQVYHSIGMYGKIKVLVQSSGSVKAPEYSHTENRVYAIVDKGALKHLAFYDKKHMQAVSIDLMHSHKGLIPHKHIDLNHKNDPGIPLSDAEKAMISALKRRFHLK